MLRRAPLLTAQAVRDALACLLLVVLAPVVAAAAGVLLGGPAPRAVVWAGVAVVAAGLAPGPVPARRASYRPGARRSRKGA